MSLSYEIRESASSVAKKYDHSELTKLHILYGIRRKFPEQLSKLSVEEIEKRISALPRVPSNVMVVSEEVEDLLSKIQYPQEALELAKTLAAQLLEINLEDLSIRTVEASAESAQEKLSLSDSLEQLNKLIGLNEVKTQVAKLINVHQANNIRSAQGLPKVPVGLHCVFTGSPGTGKQR